MRTISKALVSIKNLDLDTNSVTCQRFIWQDLTICFNRILIDDAVHSWENKIQVSPTVFIEEFSFIFDNRSPCLRLAEHLQELVGFHSFSSAQTSRRLFSVV